MSEGAVFRARGSTTKFFFGSPGSSRIKDSVCPASATVRTSRGATSGASRSTVSSIIDFALTMSRNCLGRDFRLSGQNRVPLPPAMMTARRR